MFVIFVQIQNYLLYIIIIPYYAGINPLLYVRYTGEDG